MVNSVEPVAPDLDKHYLRRPVYLNTSRKYSNFSPGTEVSYIDAYLQGFCVSLLVFFIS